MKLKCECGVELPVPDLALGEQQIVFCARCRARVRLTRRDDGAIAATRLARPEILVTCSCGAEFKAYPPDAGGVVQCGTCGRSFTATKGVRASGLAGLVAAVAVSAAPGRDQDRAAWHASSGVGCVCDGVTTSLCAGEAAELVCREAARLFDGSPDANLRALCGRLLAERGALVSRPIEPAELAAAGGRVAGVAAARSRAFQTTVLAFRVAALRPGELELTIVRCGDAALLAVGAAGVAAAVGVRGREERDDRMRHVRLADRAGGTYCLPDGVHAAETCRVRIPRDVWIVAATDGFFDGFETSRDLLGWLETHRAYLGDPLRRDPLLAELHRGLAEGEKGDDDLAFVVISPGAP